MLAWRTCKQRYDPLDTTGASMHGGRWNSPGRPVLYAADTFAGSLLEILAHTLRPRTLPGPHHSVRLEIPDRLVERLDESLLPRWHQRESAEASDFGDRWLAESRSLALVVPALPSRPVGRIVVINLGHPKSGDIARGGVFAVEWDERLF